MSLSLPESQVARGTVSARSRWIQKLDRGSSHRLLLATTIDERLRCKAVQEFVRLGWLSAELWQHRRQISDVSAFG